jgi:hypothetical protein
MSAVPGPPSAHRPEPTPDPQPPKVVIRPSLLQVVASALAAVTAAVLSGAFGVAGTFIGAAVASVVASVGSTLYLASLRTTHERLRRIAARQAFLFGQSAGTRAATIKTELPVEPSRWSRLRWTEMRRGLPTLRRRWIAVVGLAAVIFALAVAVLTGIEASTDKPVSALLGGTHGSGTSIGQTVNPPAATHPKPAPSSKPSNPGATPAPTPSAAVSPSPGASSTPSQAPSASPSAPTSSTPGATETPAPSASVTAPPASSGTLATVP